MKTRLSPATLSLCVGVVIATAGTAAAQDVNADLAALRSATASYHALDSAMAAGWDEDITGCLSSAEGGMGFHYMNAGELFDGGQLDPLRPEILVYAPDATGKKRLVAVEYLILGTDLPPTATPPEMYGEQFHYNAGFGVWALHAWVWKHNPEGIFADWNPKVSCTP
ncbi:hypothetical protein [Luteimonas vadosa]|uniref:Nuclear transport factor 2 family protein n=1 Tax=Luteimonas vadosa TaxID=1165507 RepID=A0ABP9DZ24_9GAMM